MASIIMKVLLFVTILPFSTALGAAQPHAGGLVKRQSDPLSAALLQVGNDVQQFIVDLSNIPTTQPITAAQASIISKDFKILISDINNATSICQKSKLNDDLCKKYTSILSDALPAFQKFINILINHVKAITSAGYGGLVCDYLKQLLNALQALFKCLQANCCSSGGNCDLAAIGQKYIDLVIQALKAFGC